MVPETGGPRDPILRPSQLIPCHPASPFLPLSSLQHLGFTNLQDVGVVISVPALTPATALEGIYTMAFETFKFGAVACVPAAQLTGLALVEEAAKRGESLPLTSSPRLASSALPFSLPLTPLLTHSCCPLQVPQRTACQRCPRQGRVW